MPPDPLSELVSGAAAAEAEPLSAELAAWLMASVRRPPRMIAGPAERMRRSARVGPAGPPLLSFSVSLGPPLLNEQVSGVAELEGVVDDAIAARKEIGLAGRPTVPGALVRLITCLSRGM